MGIPKNHTHKKRSSILQTNIVKPILTNRITPGDDFYSHVNFNWEHHTHIPEYKSSFDLSNEIEVSIEKSMTKLLEKIYKSHKGGSQIFEAIRRLNISSTKREYQKYSVENLKQIVRSFVCMRDTNDVSKTIGYMLRFGIKSIFKVSNEILEDKNVLTLSVGKLGLPSIEYYNGTAPGKTRTLLYYTELCQKLSKLLDINDLTLGIDVETLFITDLEMAKYDKSEIITLSDLYKKYKNISWDALFQAMGVNGEPFIRIDSPRWITFLNLQFEKLEIDQWVSLFSLHTVLYALPFLPTPYDDLHFALFGKSILGQKHKIPQKEITYWILTEKMSYQLSYIFVKNYLTESFKKECIDFVKTICMSAKKRIREIKWFEEKTKAAAIEKISNMGLSIAYPDYKEVPAVPSLLETNLLQNILLLGECNTQKILSKNGKKAHFSVDWSEPVFSVNAYYYNESNQIVIPASIFAWPFYLPSAHSSREVAWNYGGLGAAIGHEITHAFDTDGRLYDENGKIDHWWGHKDNRKYRIRSNTLVKLFSKARVEHLHIDGELTLNENIADLGGLAIALDALKHVVNMDKNRKEILQSFFISYAVSWRKKIVKQKLRQSLFLDNHAPTNLRVNLIVSQFDEWYEAFDVLPNNKLYIVPEKRIQIF